MEQLVKYLTNLWRMSLKTFLRNLRKSSQESPRKILKNHNEDQEEIHRQILREKSQKIPLNEIPRETSGEIQNETMGHPKKTSGSNPEGTLEWIPVNHLREIAE